MRNAQNTAVIFEWPLKDVHVLTSGFKRSDGTQHTGIDMRCNWDGITLKPIYAAESGEVDWVQTWDGKTKTGNMSYGTAVRVNHQKLRNGDTVKTLYAHMAYRTVNIGQYVEAGEILGYTGSTGNTFGAHLHFEVIINMVRKNPLCYLDGNFSKAANNVYTFGKNEKSAKWSDFPNAEDLPVGIPSIGSLPKTSLDSRVNLNDTANWGVATRFIIDCSVGDQQKLKAVTDTLQLPVRSE